jgi:hypothetical protein
MALAFALVLPARAFAGTEVKASVDRDTVGVGDVVRYTLEASSTEDAPSDPSPGRIDGFVLRGNHVAPSQFVMNVNGVVTRRQSVTATWVLEATRQGRFTLGPAKITVNGAVVTANPVAVKVGPPGSAPPPPPSQPSPFDLWKNFGMWGGTTQQPEENAQQVTTDPKLALDAPRASGVFLHAAVDKTSAVVGEQVTLSIYLYMDVTENRYELADEHEATANDFVKRSILPDGSEIKSVGFGDVGGRPWEVKLLRRWALFPLKSGDLEIGPMTVMAYKSRRTPAVRRESEPLRVHVTEPPIAGRPPGYVVGDVGSFQLSAEVTPRTVEEGGAVAVTVDLTGVGNLPAKLTVPTRPGVEWLEPQMNERIAVATNEKLGGKRTFTYVVRLHKEGDVDLGEMVLPYWDADARKYDVARASLGSVHVTPSARPKPAASEGPSDPLKDLPPPKPLRPEAGPSSSRGWASDSPLFWGGLAFAPLAWAVAVGGRAATRAYRRRAAERGVSPTTELKERIRAADRASEQGDARAADGATARALEAAASALVGANLRGTSGDQAVERLTARGVPAETARDINTVLRECEAARFSPEGTDPSAARDRWQRARRLIDRMKGGS